MHSESEPCYLTTELIFFNVLFETEKHNSLSFQKQLFKEIQEVYNFIKKKKNPESQLSLTRVNMNPKC